MSSQSINSLTSFSGSDLVCTIGDQAVSELQQLTWAIQREKAPIYTLGSPDPRSFSRCKRAIAGSMVFFAFDHDALLEALKRNWDKIAPPAMFTAAGNITISNSENFLDALDTVKWNKKVTENIANSYKNNGYGWSGSTEISPNDPVEGSNSVPVVDSSNFVTGWTKSESEIIVPPGFEPIRGENVNYIDTIPPFDITLTFANEYGQCAFQKIYDLEILNESSGVSVDTTVMERQCTYIARRISPLIRGVYTRDEGGSLRGTAPVIKSS